MKIKSPQKLFLITSGLGITIFVLTALYIWLGASASVKPKAITSSIIQHEKNNFKHLQGKYFSTTIPEDVSLRTHNVAPQGTRIEQILANNKKSPLNDQLAVSIGKVPPEGLNGISDIQFRQNDSKKYQITEIKNAPPGAIVFNNLETYEKSIFWVNEGKYAGVVILGSNDRRAALDNTLSIILEEWSWE